MRVAASTRMSPRWPALIVAAVCVNSAELFAQSQADPFAFFKPSVITSDTDRERLEEGGTVSRVVPSATSTAITAGRTTTG